MRLSLQRSININWLNLTQVCFCFGIKWFSNSMVVVLLQSGQVLFGMLGVMGGLVGAGCVLHNMYICRFRCRYGWLGPTWRGRLSIALVQSSGAQETSCWTGWAATICQVPGWIRMATIFRYFQPFSAKKNPSIFLQAAIRKISG